MSISQYKPNQFKNPPLVISHMSTQMNDGSIILPAYPVDFTVSWERVLNCNKVTGMLVKPCSEPSHLTIEMASIHFSSMGWAVREREGCLVEGYPSLLHDWGSPFSSSSSPCLCCCSSCPPRSPGTGNWTLLIGGQGIGTCIVVDWDNATFHYPLL